VTRRLILAFLAIAVFILVVLEVPLGLTYARRAEQQLLSRIERDTYALGTEVEEAAEGRMTDAAVGRTLADLVDRFAATTGGRAVVVDAQGVSVADSEGGSQVGRDFSSRPEFQAALGGSIVAGRRPSSTVGTDLLLVAAPQRHNSQIVGAVRVTYPRSELDALVRSNWYRLGALSAVVLASVSFVGWLIARWATRPIRVIEATAGALANGDLTARVSLRGSPSEVADLAAAFNEMAERNEELIDRQRRFVADASHQLRTPLTALSLRLESVAAGVDSAAPADRELAADVVAAEAEVRRLAGIVEQMLALSRSGNVSAPVLVDAAAIGAERVASWNAVAQDQGRELVFEVGPELVRVWATAGALEQVLDNLIANSLAYAPGGTPVNVAVAAEPIQPVGATPSSRRAVIEVIDHGPGLGDEEKRLATRRFWRAREGNYSTGSGLGLAIVESLVQAMGGSLTLSDTPGGGLTVRTHLPLAESSQSANSQPAGSQSASSQPAGSQGIRPDLAGS
jgi:signal transduction histidine kinase